MADKSEEPGPLAQKVLGYVELMKHLVGRDTTAGDGWEPLERFVAVDEFERVGPFLEVQDWRQYTQMLSHWANGTTRFETTLLRVSELAALVT